MLVASERFWDFPPLDVRRHRTYVEDRPTPDPDAGRTYDNFGWTSAHPKLSGHRLGLGGELLGCSTTYGPPPQVSEHDRARTAGQSTPHLRRLARRAARRIMPTCRSVPSRSVAPAGRGGVGTSDA
jgi:hypothetical protein